MTSHNFLRSRFPGSRRLRPALLAVVAASALALTGCNSGGIPDGSRTSTPALPESTTPSATPTPTPTAAHVPASASGPAKNVPVPVLPEVAKTETKEGLEAFAAYWYATLSYAYETGDIELLEEISAPSCVFCKGLRDGVTTAWAESRWISGGQITTPSVTAQVSPGLPGQATVQVLQQTIEIRKSDGSLYQAATKATNAGSQLTATFGTSGWLLTDLGLIR